MPHMIIANRLSDGLVVFWVSAGRWVESIEDGTLVEDDADRVLDDAKQDEVRCIVVDPNLIEVAVEDDRRRPTAMREAIRAFGPSVRTDLRDAS